MVSFSCYNVIVACLITLGPLHAAGHGTQVYPQYGHPDYDLADDLARTLFGWHYELFRGFVYPGQGDQVSRQPNAEHQRADVSRRLQTHIPAADRNFTVPCVRFPSAPIFFGHYLVDVVEPCGKMILDEKGLDFNITILGKYHVPGDDATLRAADMAANKLGWTIIFSLVVGYIVLTCGSPSRRAAALGKLSTPANKADPPILTDPDATVAEVTASKQAAMDVNSPKFIGVGNLYRLCCVMNPKQAGWTTYLGFVFKGIMCAYMQFYLPFNILGHSLKQWEYNGIKSPMYFLLNGTSFISQYIAFANIVHLFSTKCSQVIFADGGAVWYILTHTPPGDGTNPEVAGSDPTAQATGSDSTTQATGSDSTTKPGTGSDASAPLLDTQKETSPKVPKSTSKSTSKVAPADVEAPRARVDEIAKAEHAVKSEVTTLISDVKDSKQLQEAESYFTKLNHTCPAWFVDGNRVFWCFLNLTLSCTSAFMLQLCIFMQIATFTGNILKVSLVATALYFVFDLDDKIMQSDPNLKTQYTRLVKQRTRRCYLDRYVWINRITNLACAVIDWTTPFGLLMIATISWREVAFYTGTPIIIGGDPFAP